MEYIEGESAVIPASTGFPYMSGAVVAKSGQNLNLNVGEYMIIGFSSSGTTNMFCSSPANTTLSLDMAFNGSAYYVTNGFLTPMTTALQLSGLTTKMCLELY